jgi:hypothetical protein
MRILITGATGLVGSAIVAQCRERKIPVNYLSTKQKGLSQEADYRGFYWDPDKNYLDTSCFKGVGAIINLAGESVSGRWTRSRKKRILESRVNSLRTLASGLEQVGTGQIKSLVTASGISIYPHSYSEYYSETETGEDESFLGKVVSAWEKEADSLRNFGISVSKIRIGLVLSTKGGALPELTRPIKFYLGAVFGKGEQWQSWIHIEDLAGIFLFAIEENLDGIYNGVAPNPVTNCKLVRQIAEVLKKPILLPNIPEKLMYMVLGEMAYVLFVSQRVSSRKVEDAGFEFRYPNVRRALEGLYCFGESDTDAQNAFYSKFIDR